MSAHSISLLLNGLLALALVLAAPQLAATEIGPLKTGSYAVGSTNMEVPDKPAQPMIDYLKGTSGTKGVYITDIFLHPESVPQTRVEIPKNAKAYGNYAGTSLPLALYVLYPTASDNPRESYKFPYSETGDNVFPHMQKAGDKPIFSSPGARYPMIVYSTGYDAHGLWDLHHLKYLAAHGFIVVSIFHGDARKGFFDCFGIRPLELTQTIDYLLRHPDFGPAIDRDRIGVSGSSFGGYTILAAMGGKYLRSVDCQPDPRIKAGFGLVPFMGSMMRWPFGKDYAGLKSVKTPFMAVYGEKDSSVRSETVMDGISQLSGPASAILLEGEEHLLTDKVWSDVFTWEILFFNTWLKGDVKARKLIQDSTSVEGGVRDRKTVQKHMD